MNIIYPKKKTYWDKIFHWKATKVDDQANPSCTCKHSSVGSYKTPLLADVKGIFWMGIMKFSEVKLYKTKTKAIPARKIHNMKKIKNK